MNIKITYLDESPELKPKRYHNNTIQNALTEFMKSDKPAMRIDLGDHYTNHNIGRSTWAVAVKRSGYNLSVRLDSESNFVYVIKPDVERKEG